MTSKHTPPPWVYHEDQTIEAEGEHGTLWIGEVYGPLYPSDTTDASEYTEPDPETKHANGYLMAAAPELLEALEKLLEHVDYCGWGDAYEREGALAQKLPEKVAAAIAKARGEL